MPLSVIGASPSLLKVFGDNRTDGRRFVVHQGFTEELFLQCLRPAHQDIFGMVEVTTIVEYVVHRLRNAVYEEWTEDKIVLCRCLRKGTVDFCDYHELLTDLIELWPTIRPFIRCTVNPEARGKSASVSTIALSKAFVLVLYCGLGSVQMLSFAFQMLGTDWHLIAVNMIVQRFGLLRFVLDTCKYGLILLFCFLSW